jgi:FkbM family methyltransferase
MSALAKYNFNDGRQKLRCLVFCLHIELRIPQEVDQSRVMNIAGLFKPEYLYQPQRLWRRLFDKPAQEQPEFAEEALPWGLTIRIRPSEEHGKSLQTLGVIDLAVSEVLYRLTDAGEIAVDVGANIGYMTALMAQRVQQNGASGQVVAFEAHPDVFKELSHNVEHWCKQLNFNGIKIHPVAVSEQSGTVMLSSPSSFSENRGLSAVVAIGDQAGSSTSAAETSGDAELSRHPVSAVTLDDQFSSEQPIGVMKVDVEGHELSVFRGAARLLTRHQVRDCVFEEHRPYPTDVTSQLEQYGYTLFRIHRNFWGVELLPAASPAPRVRWLPTSFLATTQPERAILKLKSPGWQVLKPST